jgi:hypothetical protein
MCGPMYEQGLIVRHYVYLGSEKCWYVNALPVSWQALISKGPANKEGFWAASPCYVNCTSNGNSCTVLDLGTVASSQFPHWIVSSWIVDTIRGPLRYLHIFYFEFCAYRVGSSVMHALVEEAHLGHYIMEKAWGQVKPTITRQWCVHKIQEVVSCV